MLDDTTKATTGVSRRAFLKGVGAASVVSGIGTAAMPQAAVAADPGTPVGPGNVSITLNINGADKTLSVEPRTTLLDALRNRLDLTGAKKVCDRGTCGACTVVKNDRLIYACSTLAIDCQGDAITTIESVGSPQRLSPVQTAFIENDAQQCGFCTPGFVLACTSLLKKHPDPTSEQIRAALGGNLCRCGTYEGMKQAVLDAAKAMKGGA